jgi:hypothetical protein
MPARPFLPEVRRLSARALALLGWTDEAADTLRQARREAETMGSRWRLVLILVDLAQVLLAAGAREASSEAAAQARLTFRSILETLPEEEGWSPFAGRADVRAAMQG